VVAKSGVIDTQAWMDHSYGDRTPWGDYDSPAVVTAIETAVENDLSHSIMSAGKQARVFEANEGTVVAKQGEQGTSLIVLLDGILGVDVDGQRVAEFGPGAVMGERAIIEGGTRTATLTALTPVRLAVAEAADIDRGALERLAKTHHREDQPA
jgi:CRP-like cAMP-binding protein